ncbi:hypothetical protein PMAYCL1PPCAC_15073, partial [Pristionchus mayeri]
NNSNSMNRATIQIMMQSGIIIAVHLTTVIAFEIIPFFPPETVESTRYVAHFGWMFVHGSPTIVFLAVNRSIRQKFFDVVKPTSQITTVSTLNST